MATTTAPTISLLFSPKTIFPHKPKQTLSSSFSPPPATPIKTRPAIRNLGSYGVAGLFGAGLALTLVGPASAGGLPLLGQLSEPANALSLPTWAIHVSSVVEW